MNLHTKIYKVILACLVFFGILVSIAWNNNIIPQPGNAGYTKLSITDTSLISVHMVNLKSVSGSQILFTEYCLLNMTQLYSIAHSLDANALSVCFANTSNPNASGYSNNNDRVVIKYLNANNTVINNSSYISYSVFGSSSLCPTSCDMYFNKAIPKINLNHEYISQAQCNVYQNNLLQYINLDNNNSSKVYNFRQIRLNADLYYLLKDVAYLKLFLGYNNNNLVAYALAYNNVGLPDFNNFYEIQASDLCPSNCD
jgi:hypothetical protein